MKLLGRSGVRAIAALVVVSFVASCGLPRSGPNKREIFASSVDKAGDAFIVSVDSRVAQITAAQPALSFDARLVNGAQLGSDIISPGDVLSLSIWENVDDGLLSGQGSGVTTLQEVQVDGAGFIFVPYAGRIKAAGNTPEALRRVITNKLDSQTPDPQVLVGRLAGDGATVTLVGDVGQQGVLPIERPTRRLSGMLAQAGGVTVPTEVAQITVFRANHGHTIWFDDLFDNPKFDIALQPGDKILVEEDQRTFTVLGATGGQSRIQFLTQELSAIEAIAQVGGLNSNLADPTGIFVLRDETSDITNAVLGRTDLTEPQRVAYVLNLTEPNGMFNARDFNIRDGDTVYVTEAPFVTWNKTISALTGSLASANALASAAGGNLGQ